MNIFLIIINNTILIYRINYHTKVFLGLMDGWKVDYIYNIISIKYKSFIYSQELGLWRFFNYY